MWGSQVTTVPPADLTLCRLGLGLQPPSGLKKTITRLHLNESGLTWGHQPDPSFGVSLDSDLPVGPWQATQSPSFITCKMGMKHLLPRTAHH